MSSKNTIDLSGLSKQYAARDLPTHQKLKYREIGQAAPDEIRKERKDIRKDLEEREKIATGKETTSSRRLAINEAPSTSSKKSKAVEPVAVNLDADEVLPDSDSDDDEQRRRKKAKSKHAESDSDDSDDGNESASENDDDDEADDDDDDDDTEALMAELNKIKQERAAEAARLEVERKTREEKIRVENILKDNPLLNGSSKSIPIIATTSNDAFKVKRRWDDDVVFKNCAKMDDNKKKAFINDTLRSEFHRKFMDRYVK